MTIHMMLMKVFLRIKKNSLNTRLPRIVCTWSGPAFGKTNFPNSRNPGKADTGRFHISTNLISNVSPAGKWTSTASKVLSLTLPVDYKGETFYHILFIASS